MEAAYYDIAKDGRAACRLCLITAPSRRAIAAAARPAIMTAIPSRP